MQLHVAPKSALVDENLSIRVTGLSSYEKVKISAAMTLPWAPTEIYESHAFFTADTSGCVDLEKHKPNFGTYDWIDSMGLIISLQKAASKGKNIAEGISITQNLTFEITAECPSDERTAAIERVFQKPGIARQQITEPFIGELFHTGNPDNKTLILLGGSGGGIAPLTLIAAPFASHGFNVVIVGYFGEAGLPEHLQNIPLEYFEKVISWIAENPRLNADGIYIHGTSKGGELALLLASKYSIFTKVVANMPHAYCFQGLAGMMHAPGVSSWSYRGEPLPYIKLDDTVFLKEQQRCIAQNKPFGLTYCYEKGLEMADNKEEARIKIENASADLLLISDEKDMVWNAYDGCRDIMHTLKRHNYPHQFMLLSYEEMGHISFPVPYIIPISESLHMEIGGGVFSIGGTLAGNAHGQRDSWVKTLAFLKS